jgi:hypothetical protein
VGEPLPGRRLLRHPVHEDRPDPRGDGLAVSRSRSAPARSSARRALRTSPRGDRARPSFSPPPPRPRRPARSSHSQAKTGAVQDFPRVAGRSVYAIEATAPGAGSARRVLLGEAASACRQPRPRDAQTAPSTAAGCPTAGRSRRARSRVVARHPLRRRRGAARIDESTREALGAEIKSGHVLPWTRARPPTSGLRSLRRPRPRSSTPRATSTRSAARRRRNLAANQPRERRATRFAPNLTRTCTPTRPSRPSSQRLGVRLGIFSKIGGLPRDSFAPPRPD